MTGLDLASSNAMASSPMSRRHANDLLESAPEVDGVAETRRDRNILQAKIAAQKLFLSSLNSGSELPLIWRHAHRLLESAIKIRGAKICESCQLA
jgi:hypothetical protein